MITYDVKIGKANQSATSFKITLPKKVMEFIDADLGDTVTYALNSDGSVTLSKKVDD